MTATVAPPYTAFRLVLGENTVSSTIQQSSQIDQFSM